MRTWAMLPYLMSAGLGLVLGHLFTSAHYAAHIKHVDLNLQVLARELAGDRRTTKAPSAAESMAQSQASNLDAADLLWRIDAALDHHRNLMAQELQLLVDRSSLEISKAADLTFHRGNAINTQDILADVGMGLKFSSMPDLLESSEIQTLTPEAREQVIAEVVRRINMGELDARSFLGE